MGVFGQPTGRAHPAAAWQSDVVRYFAFLALAMLVLLGVFVALSLYEWAAFGLVALGVGDPPSYSPYYLARAVLAVLLSLVMVGGLYRLRPGDAAIHHRAISAPNRVLAWASLAAAALCTAVFAADPVLYYELVLEDEAIEWASALLPLAASGAFVYAFVQVWRSPRHDAHRSVALGLTPLFAFGLFIIGMEEISWMQRVFDIATPAMFAENQQREMNLHNMHSIIFGSIYKMSVWGFLIVLPFIAETAPKHRWVDLVRDFIPSRSVLAVSAPLAGLHYNEWNFFPSPITVLLTLFILICYVKSAHDRHDREGVALFASIAAFVVVAQTIYLALGHRFVRVWDSSEYMELFITFGLALFAWETVARLTARYGAAGR